MGRNRLTLTIQLTRSFVRTGNIAGLSLIAVPALTQSHGEDSIPAKTLAVQWRRLYNKGAVQNPPIAIGIASILSYLAWSADADSTVRFLGLATPRQLYIGSVALTMAIVPWTLLTMAPTNGKLHGKAAKVESAARKGGAEWTAKDDEELGVLLQNWNFLNALRSVLPMLGFASGALAALL